MTTKVNFFWFRRDLRLDDNAGLFHALKAGRPVIGIFIFDTNILEKLEDRKDARVTFLHNTISKLATEIELHGGQLIVAYDDPLVAWKRLIEQYDVDTVYTNRDYEAYALERDRSISNFLQGEHVAFKSFKDQVIFEGNEVVKDDNTPYIVFTPYSRKWKAKLGEYRRSPFLKAYDCKKHFSAFKSRERRKYDIPTLESIGFEASSIHIPKRETTAGLIKQYSETRDFPSLKGTSRLGIHFRFGTISIREKARKALPLNETFVNELIWRDFYSMILQHFPHVADRAFRAKYEAVDWINDEAHFQAWCEGRTGYPLVDAGMRELNETGFMHNRVRMVTASFLTKHLLTDWRWGEAYFAQKLLDFDLASNNGGWQWAAGCGTDAAPYFRIFNPTSQQKKFDKDFEYIKRYVPEYGTPAYPDPIVEHKFARERCLAAYKTALN